MRAALAALTGSLSFIPLTTSIETVPAPGTGPMPANSLVLGVINGTNSTFQTGDTINGNTSSTASILVASHAAAAPIVTINTLRGIDFQVLDAETVNATNWFNVAGVSSTRSTSELTLTNADLGSVYTVASGTGAAGFDVTFRTSQISGSSDTVSAVFNTVTSTEGLKIGNNSGIENVNISLTGGASSIQDLTIAGGTNVALNLSGNQSFTVTNALSSPFTIVSAGAATGNLTLSLGTGANTVVSGSGNDVITAGTGAVSQSISTSAGNDTITFASNFVANTSTAANNDTVNGGEGTDTLVGASGNLVSIDNTAAGAVQSISNIEILQVSDALGGNLTLSQIQAGIQQVNLQNTANGRTITFDAGVNATVQAAANTGGTLTVASAGAGTAEALTLTNSSASTDIFAARTVTSSGFETVNLVTTTGTAGTSQSVATLNVNPSAAASAVNVNLSGINKLDITSTLASTTTGLLTINGSGLTAAASGSTLDINTVTTGTGGTVSVIGSSGSDVFGVYTDEATATALTNQAQTVAGGLGNDTAIGGTEADSLNGGGGADTLFGSGGNDSIIGEDGDDLLIAGGTGDMSINGGSGNDRIVMGSTLGAADTVDGGSDVDTLVISAAVASSAVGSRVSNVEYLETTATSQDLSFFTNTTLQRVIKADDAALTVTKASASTNELQLAAELTSRAISYTRNTDTSADSLTISRAAGLAGTQSISTLTISDEETVVIDTTSTTARDLTISGIAAGDLTTLTVRGNGVTSITTGTGLGTVDRIVTVNAAQLTGAFTFNASGNIDTGVALAITGAAAQANTLTGGDGNDAFTGGTQADALTGDAGNDTMNGAAGSDVLEGGAGADNLTGGTDNNVFIYNAVVGTSSDSNSTITDTVTDLKTTDFVRLVLTNVNDFEVGADVTGSVNAYNASTNGNAGLTDVGDVVISTPSITLTSAQARAMTILNATGTSSADTISGGANNDVITGLDGADSMTGGSGADVFGYTATGQGGALQKATGSAIAAGGDTIVEFVSGSDDFNFNAASLSNGLSASAAAAVAQNGWDADLAGIAIASFTLDFIAGTTTAGTVSAAIGNVNFDAAQTAYIAIESDSIAGEWNLFQVTTSAARTGVALSLGGAADGIAYLGTATVTGNSGNLATTDFTFVG